MPFLDKFLVKNPIALRFRANNHVVQFTTALIADRLKHSPPPTNRQDFLAMFLRAQQSHPGVVTDRQVVFYSVTNVFAGSDTTAISLRAALYHLLKHPAKLRRTVAEIDGVVRGRDCWQQPVTFAEANRMPYLQAVLKEAMRVHPAVGLLLERTVPPEGCTIAGRWLPGGTVVGINPWVLHRDTEVYGEDAGEFRPERWLEVDEERLKVMERSFLAVSRADFPFFFLFYPHFLLLFHSFPFPFPSFLSFLFFLLLLPISLFFPLFFILSFSSLFSFFFFFFSFLFFFFLSYAGNE
jgi:cytochrome P450